MQRRSIQKQLLVPSTLALRQEYRDKLTGTSPNRADYQQMLADAEAGLFSHLGLYRADRFGRNAAEGLQAATKLIGLGVKLRVANMPSLTPETPDGFFMFLLQMGLAQREVDVLRQRVLDGMEAKLRAGGWAHRAPTGYVNKERLISSGKYERWVEMDPIAGQGLREAWNLLLSTRYTLAQICEELTKSGFTRSQQKPWAWTDAKTGKRYQAANRLYEILQNPFYAGWVVSERCGIAPGEIRGRWEPIVTVEEFNQGIEILRRNGLKKSRYRRHFYLLRNLLWVKANGRCFRMYCSTPSGRSQSYSYYITHAKPNGKKIHIPCKRVDDQIPAWLRRITVPHDAVAGIRELYRSQVKQATENNGDDKSVEFKRRLSQLKEEEAHLARLLVTGKLGEDTYDRLRAEWQEKFRHAEAHLADLERDLAMRLDDLDAALALLTRLSELCARFDEKKRSVLLTILAGRIIVGVDGEIVDYELQSPFAYLRTLARCLQDVDQEACGSEQIRLGTLGRPRVKPVRPGSSHLPIKGASTYDPLAGALGYQRDCHLGSHSSHPWD